MRSEAFCVRSDLDGAVAVISVAGEVDIGTAPALHSALEHAYLEGADDILVDLSDTSFIESSGLRTLLIASQKASRAGCLSVVCPNANVRRVFELTGLGALLSLHDDCGAALAWHAQRAHAIKI